MNVRYLIFIAIFLIAKVSAQPILHFDKITQKEGLSNTSVFDVYQDRKGFIWLATDDGLNRYDGYEFIVYRTDESDANSISSNRVFDIQEDNQGYLWLATSNGLNRFNPQTGKFFRYYHEPENPNSLPSNFVIKIQLDGEGALWVATRRTGVTYFKYSTNQYTRYRHSPNDEFSLSSDTVSYLHRDSRANIWVATYNGLNRYDRTNNRFNRIKHNKNKANSIVANDISAIAEDEKGNLWLAAGSGGLTKFNIDQASYSYYPMPDNLSTQSLPAHPWRILVDKHKKIWIGTFGGGLYRFDRQTQRYEHYRSKAQTDHAISSSYILSLYQDRTNVIWLGAENVGLNTFKPSSEIFKFYQFNDTQSSNAEATNVQSILESKSGDLWVGTNGDGLYRLKLDSGQYQHFTNRVDVKYEVFHHTIIDIEEDESGNLWLAVPEVGVIRFNTDEDNIQVYSNNSDNPQSLIDNQVLDIEIDQQQNLWFLSYGGVSVLDKHRTDFINYYNSTWDPNGSQNIYARQLLVDNQNRVLAITSNNIFQYNENSQQFESFSINKAYDGLFLDQELLSIYQDSFDYFWLGSRSGLFIISSDGNKASHIHIDEWQGINSNFVSNIAHDRQNYMWFTTNNELLRYNSDTGSYLRFTEEDGLLNIGSNTHNILLSGVLKRTRDGRLIIGGKTGVYVFDPDRFKRDSFAPQVAITALYLFDKKITASIKEKKHRQMLQSDISQAQQITLTHKDTVFSLEFSALHYNASNSNQYAYQLVGFDKTWRFTGATDRRATYTNLPSGQYQFRVKAANEDGVWGEQPVSLKVNILPAPWHTWWAYLGYSIFLIMLVRYIYNFQHNRLELEKQQTLNQELLKLDKVKDSFLANTTHELRTPLQGIIGISESLLEEEVESESKEKLELVIASGKRLASLINDILDYSKIEGGLLEIEQRPVDLHSTVETVFSILTVLSHAKPLKMTNEIDQNFVFALGDENRLQQIFLNLIGNAIKYTDNGSINVSGKIKRGKIEVRVQDTGLGIRPEDQESIFDLFSQARSDDHREVAGTGIGLAITKQLVELHGGTIRIQSQINQGSTFSFDLPIASESDEKTTDITPYKLVEKETNSSKSSDNTNKPYTILSVDDNPVNLIVLNKMLTKNYHVQEAKSGEQAILLLSGSNDIDLVIMDVMMPGMTGFEACKKIRQSYSYERLPIVFLTASSSEEDIQSGLQSGGNEFLEKPISRDILLATIEKYLSTNTA